MGGSVEVVIPGRQPQAGLVYLESKRNIVLTLTSLSLRTSTHKQPFVFIPVALGGRNRSQAAQIHHQGFLLPVHKEEKRQSNCQRETTVITSCS